MTPTKFKPHEDTDRRYMLTFMGGELEEIVIDVQIAGDRITFGYPYSHGCSLRIGRIEQETDDSITFTTVNSPVDLFAGVVTFRDTGESHRWS